MRKLIYIPIVHTPQDLGSHLERVKGEYIARNGLQGWRQHLKELEDLWQKTREKLMALPVDYSKVRLYQDGLPICGIELEIINKLADDGSRNHQLLLELIEKGATVMGTEDLSLLIQERNRLVNPVGKNSRVNIADSSLLYDDLMEQRDELIAQRIASTLKDGELGLLFMGALHRVVERLPDDIEACNLFDKIGKS